MDIASAEGLEGLSIGRLATELNMSKTGTFAHFGSKEQLQLATVDAAKQVFLEQVVQPSLTQSRGVPRLRAMLENWIGYVERIVFRGGCFFAAASAEFDSRPGAVRDEIASLPRRG
jgi:AcrR family transcriptional regulator